MHLLVIEDERTLCETIVRSLRPVSYTHLDVYKRQTPRSSFSHFMPSTWS